MKAIQTNSPQEYLQHVQNQWKQFSKGHRRIILSIKEVLTENSKLREEIHTLRMENRELKEEHKQITEMCKKYNAIISSAYGEHSKDLFALFGESEGEN